MRPVPRKIHLAFYIHTPAIGGAEQYLRDLIWSLDRQRYELTLFHQPWQALEQFLGLDECPALCRYALPVHEMANFIGRSLRIIPNYHCLRSALSSLSVDILHVVNGGYPGALTARLASIAAHSVHVPCVMTVASTPLRSRIPRLIERCLDQLVASAVDQFITVSREVGQGLEQRGFSAAKIKLIYCGIAPPLTGFSELDRATTRHELGLSATGMVIGMVARLAPGKGHDCLFRALAALRDKLQGKVEVLVVGGGPLLDILKARCAELGIEPLVRFTDRLPQHADVLRAMAICDVITLPSEIEGLPYTITEAMSLRKPVVATAVGGIPEQVITGESGLLVPPCAPGALAEALWLLVNNPQLAQQMGENGYARYQAYFTLEHMLKEHEAVYAAVLSARNK